MRDNFLHRNIQIVRTLLFYAKYRKLAIYMRIAYALLYLDLVVPGAHNLYNLIVGELGSSPIHLNLRIFS
jgi:hypothetical protein